MENMKSNSQGLKVLNYKIMNNQINEIKKMTTLKNRIFLKLRQPCKILSYYVLDTHMLLMRHYIDNEINRSDTELSRVVVCVPVCRVFSDFVFNNHSLKLVSQATKLYKK